VVLQLHEEGFCTLRLKVDFSTVTQERVLYSTIGGRLDHSLMRNGFVFYD
jgi:hypothetical protein